MMNMHLNLRRMDQPKKKVTYFLVRTFFLWGCFALSSPAQNSNYVTGIAYGTNYNDLATASSIASITNGRGSLVIANTTTDTLTLSHDISGFIIITNKTPDITLHADGATLTGADNYVFAAVNATNLTISGGRFIGSSGSSGTLPPLPGGGGGGGGGLTSSAVGGLLLNSTATILNAEFSGTNSTDGLYMNRTALTVSNSVFKGGATGTGLTALGNSTLTVHSGSFTGGVGNTAVYLSDSDITVYDGSFAGNINGNSVVAGDGLFSILTGATTNSVNLQGGDFSSLAFYGTEASVQNFTAGTELSVQKGIIQSGGNVVVDNQADDALTDILILSGTMSFPSNAFTLLPGGNFTLDSRNSRARFGQLDIAAGAAFKVGLGQLEADTLSLHADSELYVDIGATTQGFITTDSTYFHTDYRIDVDATAAGFSSGSTNIAILSATSNQLYMVGSSTNVATSSDFTTNNITASASGRSFLSDITVENGRLLNLKFTTVSLTDYWNVGGQMLWLANDLETINYKPMMILIDQINNPTLSAAAVEHVYFTTPNTFQIAMQGLQAAVGQTISRGTDFREQLKLLPTGAKGPERNNTLRGWGKYYGQFYNHDDEGMNSGYDTTLHGGVIGIDQSFNNLLVGISGGASHYSTDGDDDSSEGIDAAHGSVYATYGMDQAYLDASIAYGYNSVETETGGPFRLNGDFDAHLLSAYIGGGFDIVDPKSATVFTPEASIQYTTYKQDSYDETGTTAVPRQMDSFDADSLRSSLGLNMSMIDTTALGGVGYKIDTRFHWMHEFNSDPGDIKFSLPGGSYNYWFAYPELDDDLFRAGFGMSFFNTGKNKPKNVMLRLDFDEVFGDGFNSHNISAKLTYAF